MTLAVLLLAGHLLLAVFFWKDQRDSIACHGVAWVLEQGLQPSPGEAALLKKDCWWVIWL